MGDLMVKSTLWHHLPFVGTGAHYTGCPFPAAVVSHAWMSYVSECAAMAIENY